MSAASAMGCLTSFTFHAKLSYTLHILRTADASTAQAADVADGVAGEAASAEATLKLSLDIATPARKMRLAGRPA